MGAWKNPVDNEVWIRFSANGSWDKVVSSDTLSSLSCGDLNGDGLEDVLGSWSYGVWWRDSFTQIWERIHPWGALQLTAGDADGDQIDDVIGMWTGAPGIWVRHSQTGNWEKLIDAQASWIDTGHFH